MRLLDAHIGEVVRVVGFKGSNVTRKLNRLGLYPGDAVQVLRRAPFGGPLMLMTSGRELALGRSVAEKILVEAA